MNSDLISMLGNISRSFFPVQHLVSGLAYVLGIIFFLKAIRKFRQIAEKGGHEKMFVPIMYMIAGSAMIFMPTMVGVLANTVFGVGNILSYSTYNQYDIYSSMGVIVRTAGVIWFIRGCVLVAHASEPGVQEGPKGMMFLFAGILSINFDNTVYYINYAAQQIFSSTI